MNGHRINFSKAILLLGILVIAAIFLSGCSGPTSPTEGSSQQAQQLAQQLNTALSAAGLPEAPISILTTLYGEDGGLTCTNAGQLQNKLGTAQFGSYAIGRRVIMDPKILAYEKAVITTYCPDKLAAYESVVSGLKTAPTIP
jgi:hypothetical protein